MCLIFDLIIIRSKLYDDDMILKQSKNIFDCFKINESLSVSDEHIESRFL